MINKTQNPAEIYLIPVFDGEHDHVWCDTPAPGEGMDPEDAIKYVQADLVPASNEVLAKRIVELTGERDAMAAQLASKTDIANQLKDGLAESFEKQMELKAQVKQLRGGLNQAIELLVTALIEPQQITDKEICELRDIEQATPVQCLAEVKAQAVRDGFIEGVRQMAENEIGWFGHDAESCANHYANQLRQSAKGE